MKRHHFLPFALTLIFLTFNLQCLGAKAKKVSDPATLFSQAKEAFYNYDFEEAQDFLDQYESSVTKSKKTLPEEAEIFKNQLDIASRAYNSVQQIEIIDTITVGRDDFFKVYKLAQSTGKIGPSDTFGLKGINPGQEIGFINESGDYLITAQSDQEETFHLMENRRLLDGTWETIVMLDEENEPDGDNKYPFLRGDGQTFYFANNGSQSMGGYDLFVVQKQPLTGESLQPLNLGMPFNSPYDDFMMVIDEENGNGWWASDRNSPSGDVTIYVYKLSEIRKNYPSDTEDLKEHARLQYIHAN